MKRLLLPHLPCCCYSCWYIPKDLQIAAVTTVLMIHRCSPKETTQQGKIAGHNCHLDIDDIGCCLKHSCKAGAVVGEGCRHAVDGRRNSWKKLLLGSSGQGSCGHAVNSLLSADGTEGSDHDDYSVKVMGLVLPQ